MNKIAVRGNQHTCPLHGGGEVYKTQEVMQVGDRYVATIDDLCHCSGGADDPIVSGSSVMTINGKAVARKGDRTAHNGEIVEGIDFFELD